MPDLIRLEGFLSRNAYPFTTLDAATDPDASAAIANHRGTYQSPAASRGGLSISAL
jgi:hypothetical protein